MTDPMAPPAAPTDLPGPPLRRPAARASLLIGAATLCLLLLASWIAGQWYAGQLLKTLRADVKSRMIPHGNTLSRLVHERFARLSGLHAFVGTVLEQGDDLESHFRIFAPGLYGSASDIRNFVIAPGGVNRYVYPLERNKVVPGHDQFQDRRPAARADARRALKTGKIVLTGPYELRQGGLGLVARRAVFREGRFWGMASMVIDLPPILAQAGLDDAAGPLRFALKRADGEVFFGGPEIFDRSPVTLIIDLPDGAWTLAAMPRGGWGAAIRRPLLAYRITGAAFALLLSLLAALITNRQTRLREAVREKTAEIERINQALQRDIEERKESEAALRRSEARYRFLFEHAPVGIVQFDSDGVILDANEAQARIIGTSRDRLLGFDMLRSMAKGPARQAVADAIRSGAATFEGKYTTVNGGRDVVLKVHHKVIRDDQGRFQVGIGIYEDVTEKHRLEERLRQSQKMEAIGTLAGGIAHDFNNILFPIIGYTEMALDDLPVDGVLHRNLKEVLRAAGRARDAVRQILAFTRLDQQELRPLLLQPIVKEAAKLLRASIPATIEIRVEVANDAGPILADPSQIHQIVMNLCTNAYHAMREDGGVLRVGIFHEEIGAEPHPAQVPPGRYTRLSVADTGPGIDPKIADRIFEPYFTTKAVGEGTGLGLSVVHGIVKRHQGYIHLAGEPGGGAAFDIYFPQVSGSAAALCDGDPVCPAPVGGAESVLLVDDEPQNVAMVAQMLTRLGYAVSAETDGRRALSVFTEEPNRFDLLITDLTMPGLTGIQLAEAIHRVRPELPVLLCTGYGDPGIREKCLEVGIQGQLSKPILFRELSDALRGALEEARRR